MNENNENQQTVNVTPVNTPTQPIGPTAGETTTPNVVTTPIAEKQPETPQMPVENNEQIQNEEPQKGGPNKLKTFLAILLFLFFFALVYYLPEITNFINEKKGEMNKTEITTGTLSCVQEKSTSTLNVNITAVFTFVNNEITKLTYTQTSTGDKIDDKEELEKLKQDCSELKGYIVDVDGISIVCSLNNGVNTMKQEIDYEKVDKEKISSGYIEAGGIYPEFKKGEKISSVESKMAASYKCEKY